MKLIKKVWQYFVWIYITIIVIGVPIIILKYIFS